MKLKIFKSALYTIVMVLSIHTYATSQGVSAGREKAMEEKMQKLELRLKDMQAKLDSITVKKKSTNYEFNYDYSDIVDKALKSVPKSALRAPRPPKLPPMPNVEALINESISKSSKAFEGLSKSMNFNFDNADSRLADKIKSGEIKEKVKTYSKSYSVNSGDKLQIDNRYGKVIINTWNKNEFKVDVEMKALSNDDDETAKLLDGVSISDSKDSWVVSFVTHIESQNNSWGTWTSGGKSRVRKLEVNYVVYMPSKNALEITNKYGGTVLPDFDGKVTINSSYGSFTAKSLTNAGSDIVCKYGSANIESLKGGKLSVSYGSLSLGSGDNLNATISYSSAKIDRIKTSGSITLRYSGGLRIGDLDKNFKNISINSSYSSVMVGLNNDPNFDFDVSVHYGSFSYGDHSVNISAKTPDDERRFNPTKTYKGHLGKGNADRLVTIKSSYGSVKFD